ncbi:hypothetical protein [Staphylococcus caeli]|uniref:hypothetical protein n=1 Tax=Staphylococcus caeli TaxID=2201815 RepID=UPI003F544E6E
MEYKTIESIRDHVDLEDKGVGKIQTPGGHQNVTLITESGLYSLIYDAAKQSKSKTIRKTARNLNVSKHQSFYLLFKKVKKCKGSSIYRGGHVTFPHDEK